MRETAWTAPAQIGLLTEIAGAPLVWEGDSTRRAPLDAHVLSPVDESIDALWTLFHPRFTGASRPLYIRLHKSCEVASTATHHSMRRTTPLLRHHPDGLAASGPTGTRLDRRRFLQAGMTAGIAGVGMSPRRSALLDSARAHRPRHATLSDIEHVVILMQENRSFDHYFGTLSQVRGFSKGPVLTRTVGRRRVTVFDQFGYKPGTGVDASGCLQPFHLASDPPSENGQTTNDISHDWGPQHESWNGGSMDAFVTAHIVADGAANGPVTMGYLTRDDLAFNYALADAFTICDGYHCSVLGPTDPNRVMSISASIDPTGAGGGPVLETLTGDRQTHYGTFTWETMPERLSEAGVSWKVYNDPTALLELSPFPYFKSFTDPSSPAQAETAARALTPVYPASFQADVATGSLPAVSWIMPPLAECEHPAAPPTTANSSPRRSSRPSCPTPRSGPGRSSSLCTTRTAASSTTSPRPRRRRGHPGNT